MEQRYWAIGGNMLTKITRINQGVSSSNNANNVLDRDPPTMSDVRETPVTDNHCGTNSSTQ